MIQRRHKQVCCSKNGEELRRGLVSWAASQRNRGNSHTPHEKPQKQMHPNTYIPKEKKKSSPLRPYKIRNTPPRHIAQNKHSPKCSHWFTPTQTLAGKKCAPKKPHKERTKTHNAQTVGSCYTLFIFHRHPGELRLLLSF